MEFWPTFAAILYTLGIALFYMKVVEVFSLLDQMERLSRTKLTLICILWPVAVVWDILLLIVEED